MKLAEALLTLRNVGPDARPLPLHLVCGFTPLHLQTFLGACVQKQAPGRKAVIQTGLFDDCIGSLERLGMENGSLETVVVALEWSDFDPRLGLRRLGGWGPGQLPDIVTTVAAQTRRCGEAIQRLAERVPVRLSLPTLALPPLSYHPASQAGWFELDLQAQMQILGSEMARLGNVAVVNPQQLDRVSPPAQRRDVTAELASGFPYTLGHAAALGQLLAQLVQPNPPRKGLITDLDDTLWRGILGDAGPNGVHWDLERKSHAHALYQQTLIALAEAGVLIAVASKNDPDAVNEIFANRDELSSLKGHLFPLQVSWGPKSLAVGEILPRVEHRSRECGVC